jgi:hypothetical protein
MIVIEGWSAGAHRGVEVGVAAGVGVTVGVSDTVGVGPGIAAASPYPPSGVGV